MIAFTGFLTVFFVVLAALNGMKRKVKYKPFRRLMRYHKLFGGLAAVSALLHMSLTLLEGELRITGTIALLFVLTTAFLGGSFHHTKDKRFYKIHRIIGPLSLLAILVHIIFNSSF
ncbi:MAG: hypothetical protein ACLFUQ_07235 [Candidatus Izemoplasmataceae bacterium]